MCHAPWTVCNTAPPPPLSRQRFGPKKLRKQRLALFRQGECFYTAQAQRGHSAKQQFNYPVTTMKSTRHPPHVHMAQTAKILLGPKPNVTHNPPRPKAGKRMFHPCSRIPMNSIIGLLRDSQCLAANESDVGPQSSLTYTIMYPHLRLCETVFGALWPKLVPYLNIGTHAR